jgi:RNA polymerase sigma-70 factor, ECF subfamily
MLNINHLILFAVNLHRTANPMEDRQLARRVIQDPEAFSEIYERHLPGVYRYHLARTGNIQDAQDLAAQTFLTALESIGSFRGVGSLAAWLFGIASHKLADHHRHKRPVVELDAGMELGDQAPLPEEVVLHNLDMDRVAKALRAIAPERAEALGLRIFGCLSTEEVAESMHRSIPAVKMLISRGLSDLSERLAHKNEVES